MRLRDRVDDHDGRMRASTALCMPDEVHLEPVAPSGREARIRSMPLLTYGSRSIPIERMLRTSCDGGLLEGEEEAPLAPRAGGGDELGGDARLAGAGGARDEDGAALEVAGPPSISSRRGMPVETRSLEAVWWSPSEVMGRTEMPARRSGTGTRWCRGSSRGTSRRAAAASRSAR